MSSGGLFGYRGLGLYERFSSLTSSVEKSEGDERNQATDEQVAMDATRRDDDMDNITAEAESEAKRSTKIHLNFMSTGQWDKVAEMDAEEQVARKATGAKANEDEERSCDDEAARLVAEEEEEEQQSNAIAEAARKLAEAKAKEEEEIAIQRKQEFEARLRAKTEAFAAAVAEAARVAADAKARQEEELAARSRELEAARLAAEEEERNAIANAARELAEAKAKEEEEIATRRQQEEEAEAARTLLEAKAKEEEELAARRKQEEASQLAAEEEEERNAIADATRELAEAKAKEEEEIAIRRQQEEEAEAARTLLEAKTKEEEELAARRRHEEAARLAAGEEKRNAIADAARELAEAKAKEEEEIAARRLQEEEAESARTLSEAKTKEEEELAARRRQEEAARLAAEEEERNAIANAARELAEAKAKEEEEIATRRQQEEEAEAVRALLEAKAKEEEELAARRRHEEAARLAAEEEEERNAIADAARELAEAKAKEEEEIAIRRQQEEEAEAARTLLEAKAKEEEELAARRRHEEAARLAAEEEKRNAIAHAARELAEAKAKEEEEIATRRLQEEEAEAARTLLEAKTKEEEELAARRREEEAARLAAEEEERNDIEVLTIGETEASRKLAYAIAEEELAARCREDEATEEDHEINAIMEEPRMFAEVQAKEQEKVIQGEQEKEARFRAEAKALAVAETEAKAVGVVAEAKSKVQEEKEDGEEDEEEKELAARRRKEEAARLAAEEESNAIAEAVRKLAEAKAKQDEEIATRRQQEEESEAVRTLLEAKAKEEEESVARREDEATRLAAEEARKAIAAASRELDEAKTKEEEEIETRRQQEEEAEAGRTLLEAKATEEEELAARRRHEEAARLAAEEDKRNAIANAARELAEAKAKEEEEIAIRRLQEEEAEAARLLLEAVAEEAVKLAEDKAKEGAALVTQAKNEERERLQEELGAESGTKSISEVKAEKEEMDETAHSHAEAEELAATGNTITEEARELAHEEARLVARDSFAIIVADRKLDETKVNSAMEVYEAVEQLVKTSIVEKDEIQVPDVLADAVVESILEAAEDFLPCRHPSKAKEAVACSLAQQGKFEEFNLEEFEEAATKASSVDEAKSSTVSEDGIDIGEEVVYECSHQAVDTAGAMEGPNPAYFYIGDVNCKVQSEAATPTKVESPLKCKMPVDTNDDSGVAHWISPQYVSWSVANTAPVDSRFYLCVAGTADSAVVRHEMEIVRDPEELRSSTGCMLLKLLEDAISITSAAHHWCQQAISICCEEPGAVAPKVAAVAFGALLDELFRFDGPLGCHIAATVDIGVEGFQFSLWAPTARGVVLVLYDCVDGQVSGEVPMVREDEKLNDGELNDGVWRAWGPLMWRGKYYSYRVQAYCPMTKQLRCTDIPDPYASVYHPGAVRSLVCSEVSVPRADEAESCTRSKPMLVHRAKATIFELSDADLGALDTSCSSSSHRGHIDLRRLADAGITHVYIRNIADVDAQSLMRCKDMVACLHAEGLRVVVDAPLTCASAASTIAKYTPGYCLLHDDNSLPPALGYQMVEQLVVNRFVHWAVDLQVDGFCLEPSMFTSKCMRTCRAALNALTLERHNVDGPRILLYAKGGLPQDIVGRGDIRKRDSLYCGGISCSNTKISKAIGSLCRRMYCEGDDLDESSVEDKSLLCHGLVAGLNEYRIDERCYGAEPIVASPDEVVNCVSTLHSELIESCTQQERLRIAWLGIGAVTLAHGTPLVSFQDELLRLVARQRAEAENSTCFERMYEFLKIRSSTPLFSLTDPRDILEKVAFPAVQENGVVVMQTHNGPPARFRFVPPLCDSFARIVVVLSMRRTVVRVPAPCFAQARSSLQLHPVQVESVDESTRSASFDAETDELVVPPLSVVVFVEPRLEEDSNL